MLIIIPIGRSSWSRAKLPLEVGDVLDDQAIEYLQKRGILEEVAKQTVKELTGGRLLLLRNLSDEMKAGKTYEGSLVGWINLIIHLKFDHSFSSYRCQE